MKLSKVCWLLCAQSIAFAVAAMLPLQPAAAASEQQELVAKAEATFSHFKHDPNMEWFRDNIGKAKAVLIAPEIVKAGFILGGSGGRAVLLARDPKTGEWRGPAFYSLFTPSVGLQAGVAVSEVVTLVMTEKALNGLLATSLKMGGDVSIAAGPIGEGAAANVDADMIAYVRSKGIYGGINLSGTAVRTSDEWNETFYSQPDVLPPDILIRGTAVSAGGEKLRKLLAAAAK
ncbi:MAG TPA: lipid-binding SYLF domain-containing protein [Burkholderiales bacterium]|nr:lipid-binding SYLF domain-containing protein [Burkholderiales bacterium]